MLLVVKGDLSTEECRVYGMDIEKEIQRLIKSFEGLTRGYEDHTRVRRPALDVMNKLAANFGYAPATCIIDPKDNQFIWTMCRPVHELEDPKMDSRLKSLEL